MHYYANYIFMNTIKIAEADQTRISLTKYSNKHSILHRLRVFSTFKFPIKT